MKFKVLIVIAILVVGGLFAALSLSGIGRGGAFVELNDKIQLTPSLGDSAAPYGDDTVVFSNGRALATYNVTSGETAVITPVRVGSELGFVDSISVSDDKQYILFHTNLVAKGGLLADRLAALSLDPALDYWWIYNVQQKVFTPLPQSTTIAKFGGDKVYTLSGIAPEQHIQTYTPNDVRPVSTLQITPANNFFPTGRGFVLETPDNEILLTQDGVVSTGLAKSATAVGITADEQTLVAIQREVGEDNEETGPRSLVSIPVNNQESPKTIEGNFEGGAVMSPAGVVLYTTPGDKTKEDEYQSVVHRYDTATQKSARWKLADSTDNGSTPLTPFVVLNSEQAIVGKDTQKYLVGNSLHQLKDTNLEYAPAVELNGTPINVAYDEYNKGFVAYPALPDKQSELNLVSQRLKADGYNPDLYRILLIDVTD